MKKLLSTTAMAVVLATQSLGLAHAQEEELRRVIEQQQQELETLKQRFERMENDSWSVRQDIDAIHEAREETEAVLGTAVTRGDHPGSFKIPGTNTSVKIGGYVKADFIYDVDADLGDSFAASAIPADGSDADRKSGNFRSHAKQTRLNFSTWTPTEVGEVKLFIEGDFFGQGGNQTFSNSTTFRLRHAFGEIGLEQAEQVAVERRDAAQHILAKERVEGGPAQQAPQHRSPCDSDRRHGFARRLGQDQRAVPEPKGQRQAHHPGEVAQHVAGGGKRRLIGRWGHESLRIEATTTGFQRPMAASPTATAGSRPVTYGPVVAAETPLEQRCAIMPRSTTLSGSPLLL
jgi:hypothetical protein